MVFYLFEEIMPGRGHGAHGSEGATVASLAGTDFRRGRAPYGSTHFFAASGGGASKGCDGWVNQFCVGDGGNLTVSSVELVELAVPQIVWEVGIVTDSGGAGQWRGAPGSYHRIQPRQHDMTIIAFGIGHTDRPLGVAGGKPGTLVDHWIERHGTHGKVRNLSNIGIFEAKAGEDWVCYANGGGGYGDPLERDPEIVRDDARNYIVSVKAARDEYGVVLDTKPELYEVDDEATEKLRAELKKERGTK
jgi:N-methylhydantoinase B